MNLLPRVVSGTSAGAPVAAFVCYAEDEFRSLLVPGLADQVTVRGGAFDVWSEKVFGGILSDLAHSEGDCEISVEHGEGGGKEDG